MTEGFLIRLRCGGSQRERFYLQCRRVCDFEQRAERMRAMASALVRAGKLIEAPIVLRKAAEQPTEALFSKVEKRCQELCQEAPAVTGPAPLARTFRDLGELWTSGALHRKYRQRVDPLKPTTTTAHIRRLAWLYKQVGAVPLAAFTREHANGAMEALSDKIKGNTRLQYARLLTRVLNLACEPCGLIDHSPLPRGWAGKPDRKVALSFLYPTEDAQLLGCEQIPLEMRMLYGVLAREGFRSGEAMWLQWSHIDFTRGAVRLDENKTDQPRVWKLDPGVVRALTVWKPEGATGHVFPRLPRGAAKNFREHLRLAGVDRPELFERSEHRAPIRVHDLRGTFVTLSLANRWTEREVMDRTGHTTSTQLQGYHHKARLVTDLDLGPLLPLDEALGLAKVSPGRPGPVRARVGQRVGQRGMIRANSAGQERIEDAFTEVQELASAPETRVSGTAKHAKMQRGPAGKRGVGQNADHQTSSPDEENDMSDSVERELVRALRKATDAGEWHVAQSIVTELTERRRLGSDVVSLDAARKNRGRSQ